MLLSSAGTFGRLVRLPLRLVSPSWTVRVLTGAARGFKWRVGSANHGYWLGIYERDKQQLMGKIVKTGDVVFDIGANAGFYTLLLARLVGRDGRVVAFEPLAANLDFLREHVRLNAIKNVTVRDEAVSDADGELRFATGESTSVGRLSSTGAITVRSVQLDSLIDEGEIPHPDVVKIDIEGAEARALRGAARLMQLHATTFLVATHGSGVHEECIDILKTAGYEVREIGTSGDELVAIPLRSGSRTLTR